MKNLISISILFILISNTSIGQNINWMSANSKSNHSTNLSIGYNFGMVTQVGHSYNLKTKVPIWINSNISIPFGADRLDDLKMKVGVQIPVFQRNSFLVTMSANSIYRRYQSGLVTMAGFGAEFKGSIGFIKANKHIALKVGFDKSIVTRLSHTELMKQNYTEIQSGWFLDTGGHWSYGVTLGRSIKRQFYVTLDLGLTNAQGDDQNALIPLFMNIQLAKTF